MDLKIPELEKTGKRLFKTSAPAVRQWVDNLPLINIEASVKQLEFALDEINKTDIPTAERHAALDMLNTPVMHVTGALVKSYLGKQFPLKKHDLDNAAKATALRNRMASGYKILVAIMEKQHVSRSVLTIAIHRAMRYLSEILIGDYQIYVPYPDGIWKDLHTLYALAEQHGLLKQQVEDITLHTPARSTIEDIYKQVLLLSLACPYRLRQNEISDVYILLSKWAPYSKLIKGSEESRGGFFTWSLESDHAPAYLTIRSREDRDTHWRNLNTSDMSKPVRAALEARQQSTQRYSDHLEERILQRLMLSWGVMPKRQFTRRQQDASIELVVGLKAIHSAISDPRPEPEPEPEQHDAVQAETEVIRDREYLQDPTFERPTSISTHPQRRKKSRDAVTFGNRPERWQNNPLQGAYAANKPAAGTEYTDPMHIENWKMQDMSAGGYCLLWDSEEPSSARVGELVAIKTSHDTDDNWHLGVIRWMKFTQERGLGLGVQMMSPGARAIWARVCNDKAGMADKMQGILLPDIKGLNQQATLLLPSLPFRTGYLSRLTRGDKEERVKLTAQLEDTGSFAQYHFTATEES
jgi:hypothetical protein